MSPVFDARREGSVADLGPAQNIVIPTANAIPALAATRVSVRCSIDGKRASAYGGYRKLRRRAFVARQNRSVVTRSCG